MMQLYCNFHWRDSVDGGFNVMLSFLVYLQMINEDIEINKLGPSKTSTI